MSSLSDIVDLRNYHTDGSIHLLRWLKWLLSAISFWSAVILPMIYLTLLFTRLDSTSKSLWFLALVGLHILTLIAGHSFQSHVG